MNQELKRIALELAASGNAGQAPAIIVERAKAFAEFLDGRVMADNAAEAVDAKATKRGTPKDEGLISLAEIMRRQAETRSPVEEITAAIGGAAAEFLEKAMAFYRDGRLTEDELNTLEREPHGPFAAALVKRIMAFDANTNTPRPEDIFGTGKITLNGIDFADLFTVEVPELQSPLFMQMFGRGRRASGEAKIDVSGAFTRPDSRFTMADLADMAEALVSPDLAWPDLRAGDIVRCIDAQGVSHLEHGTCYLVTERREYGVELDREPGMTAGPYHLRRFEIASRPLRVGDGVKVDVDGGAFDGTYRDRAAGDQAIVEMRGTLYKVKFEDITRADGEPLIASGTYECISKPSEARAKAGVSAEVWRQMKAAKAEPAEGTTKTACPGAAPFREGDVVEQVSRLPVNNRVGDRTVVTRCRPSVIMGNGYVVETKAHGNFHPATAAFKLVARPVQVGDRVRFRGMPDVLTVDEVNRSGFPSENGVIYARDHAAKQDDEITSIRGPEHLFTHEDGTPTMAPPVTIKVTDDAAPFKPIPVEMAGGRIVMPEAEAETGVTDSRIGARPLSNENLKALAEAVYGDRRHSTRELVRLQEGVHLAGPEQVERALNLVRSRTQAAFNTRGVH